MKPRFVFLIAFAALALSACGNKGPLVQAPRKPAEEVPATPPTDGSESAPAETTPPPAETEPAAEPETEAAPPDADGGG